MRHRQNRTTTWLPSCVTVSMPQPTPSMNVIGSSGWSEAANRRCCCTASSAWTRTQRCGRPAISAICALRSTRWSGRLGCEIKMTRRRRCAGPGARAACPSEADKTPARGANASSPGSFEQRDCSGAGYRRGNDQNSHGCASARARCPQSHGGRLQSSESHMVDGIGFCQSTSPGCPSFCSMIKARSDAGSNLLFRYRAPPVLEVRF